MHLHNRILHHYVTLRYNCLKFYRHTHKGTDVEANSKNDKVEEGIDCR
jgi:hypothetical protein